MSLLHVRQIETHLRDVYAGEHWKDELNDDNNLSRLLARYAVDMALGDAASDVATLVEITDGEQDGGIDAVAVDPLTNLVVVVQSKWRKDGSGSVDLGSVLKFVDGVRSLLDIDSTGIATCSVKAKSAVRSAMQTPGGRLRMVIATTAANDLAAPVQEPISKLLAVLNDVGDGNAIADVSIYTQSTFFDALAQPVRQAVDLDVQILDWGRNPEPVASYYGRVNAAQIASWFVQHGASLFAENIRVVLPRSEINEGIMRTVREEPDRFWYYNNGITVLAGNIERSLAGAASRDAVFLRLKDASVVNGAQTVSTLGRALQHGLSSNLEAAYVSIRAIEVTHDDPDLARRITRFANTQNVVSSQDFVFLDAEQHRLAKELRLAGYEYILRSGEVASSKEADKVLEVRQAAVALACASTELSHAVLAKREVSRLFDREAGPYKALFNASVNGLLLHRAVDVVRRVDQTLDAHAAVSDGVRGGVAVHGRRVIAHMLLNAVGRRELSDPDYDFTKARGAVFKDASKALDSLTAVFPENSYPGNVFKNQARCAELLEAAKADAGGAADDGGAAEGGHSSDDDNTST